MRRLGAERKEEEQGGGYAPRGNQADSLAMGVVGRSGAGGRCRAWWLGEARQCWLVAGRSDGGPLL